MKLLSVLAAAVLAMGVSASAASAAVVTRSFEFFATNFGPGAPLANVSGTFTITFDPALSVGAGTLDTLSVPGLGLNAGNTGFTYSAVPGMPMFSALTVGGVVGGIGGVAAGANDFALSFMGPGTDPFSYLPLSFSYSTAGGSVWAGDFQVSPAAPVPEPATWAMMIAGFGLAGAALRRRKGRGLFAAA